MIPVLFPFTPFCKKAIGAIYLRRPSNRGGGGGVVLEFMKNSDRVVSEKGCRQPGPLIIRGPREIRSCYQLVTYN